MLMCGALKIFFMLQISFDHININKFREAVSMSNFVRMYNVRKWTVHAHWLLFFPGLAIPQKWALWLVTPFSERLLCS